MPEFQNKCKLLIDFFTAMPLLYDASTINNSHVNATSTTSTDNTTTTTTTTAIDTNIIISTTNNNNNNNTENLFSTNSISNTNNQNRDLIIIKNNNNFNINNSFLISPDTSNSDTTNTLNVNGRKLFRNKEKTIWSYNPDDTSIKPYKYKWNKLKNQQLNNFEERSQTATFTSYFLNQHQFDSNQQQDINKSNTKYNKAKSTYYEFPKEEDQLPKSLNTIDAFSYTLNNTQEFENQLFQIIPVMTSTVESSNMKSISGCNSRRDSLNTPIEVNGRSSSTTNTKMVDFNLPITTPSQLIEKYRVSSSNNNKNNNRTNTPMSCTKTDEVLINEEIPSEQEDEYLRSKINIYKTNLSKLIKNRYTTEPFVDPSINPTTPTLAELRRQQTKSASSANSRTKLFQSQINLRQQRKQQYNSQFNQSSASSSSKVYIYGKHIDTLTSEILEALSNGINKNLLISDSNNREKMITNYDNGTYSDYMDDYGDDELLEGDFYEDDDEDDYLDDEDFDEEKNDDDYDEDLEDGEDENEYYYAYNYRGRAPDQIDYEDDRIIVGTNINMKYQKDDNDVEDNNLVMKICNDIKSYKIDPEENDEKNQIELLKKKQKLKKNKKLRLLRMNKLRRSSRSRGKPNPMIDINNGGDMNNPALPPIEITTVDDNLEDEIFKNEEAVLEKPSSIRGPNVSTLDFKILNKEYPANYFDREYPKQKQNTESDPNSTDSGCTLSDDFKYDYTDVISEEFRRVFERYDATTTADYFIKQQLPPSSYYLSISQSESKEKPEKNDKKNDEDSENGQESKKSKNENTSNKSQYEMYNILKRMMVKKKYVLATVKLEKESNLKRSKSSKKVNNNNSSSVSYFNSVSTFKTRPSTAATANSVNETLAMLNAQQQQLSANTKLSRPKTVNILPVSKSLQLEPVIMSEDTNVLNKINTKSRLEQVSNMISTNLDEEFYYDPFRLSPTSLNNQTWPYEIDFDKPYNKRQGAQSSKSNKSNKCYTCKKLPVVNKSDTVQNSSSQSTSNQPVQLTNQQNNTQLNTQNAKNTRLQIVPALITSYGTTSNQQLNTQQQQISTTTITASILNSTYNSDRRCVSAKLTNSSNNYCQQNPSALQLKSLRRQSITSAKLAKLSIDNIEHSKNNYNSDYDIDKDVEDEEDILAKKNLYVNKEEHMRRMSILPGKSFRSQRRKSISVEHVPVSKKKIDTQKARIPLTTNHSNPYQAQLVQQQQQHHQQLVQQLISGHTKKMIVKNQVVVAKSSQNVDLGLKPSNLAVQHQEEIYSLIDSNTSSGLKKGLLLANKLKSSISYGQNKTNDDSEQNGTIKNFKLNTKIDLSDLSYLKKQKKISVVKNRRPKTSKY